MRKYIFIHGGCSIVPLVFCGVNDMVLAVGQQYKLLICRSECAHNNFFFQLTDGEHGENGIFDVWTFRKKAWVVSNPMDKCADPRRYLSHIGVKMLQSL